MPRNHNGKWTFSAGEVANFEVCQYSWHLEHIQKVKIDNLKKNRIGEKKHKLWNKAVQKSYFYNRGFRVILYILALLIFMIFNFKS